MIRQVLVALADLLLPVLTSVCHSDSSETLSRIFESNGDALAPGWNPDPDEQTYCICNQVSYGEMVACDNEDVSCCLCSRSSPLICHCCDSSVRSNGSITLVSRSVLRQKANGSVRSV